MPEHSSEFVALRDAVIDGLDDADRRRLVDLFGCMTDAEKKPAPSAALVRALAMFVALDPRERTRFARWCATYLSRWVRSRRPLACVKRRARPGRSRRRSDP
jgi:hypothetical protein